MLDPQTAILEELERLAPAAEVAQPRWRDVQRRGRERRRPPRRLVFAGAAAALVAVLAPALALSAGLRSLVWREPDTPRATMQFQISLPHGWVYRAFTAPEKGAPGPGCYWVGFAHANVPPADTPLPGYGCVIRGSLFRRGLHTAVEVQNREPIRQGGPGLPHATVSGWVKGVHAAYVDLVWHGGRLRLRAFHGFILAAPEILYRPPRHDLPFAVVAYDAHGRAVARQRIRSSDLYPRG